MSICANFYVLFRETPAAERIDAIEELVSNRTGFPAPANRNSPQDDQYERLLPVLDADFCAEISHDGALKILDSPRNSRLLGEPSLEGRLFENSTLRRHWTKENGSGHVIHFALTMLTLLSQSDIEWVWYTSDYNEGLRRPVTQFDVHQMIDDFIRVGDLTDGRPTRFIMTAAGVINI